MFQAFIPDYKRWLSGHYSFKNTYYYKYNLAKQGLKLNIKKAISSHLNTNYRY